MRDYHKKRLLKLARMLVADAKKKKGIKFDLRVVGESSLQDPKLDCGTKACAMGLAAMSGEFKKAGLSYKVAHFGSKFQIQTTWRGAEVYFSTAAARLFGISESAAEYLFHPYRYPRNKLTGAGGEKFVADRIRKLVKTGRTDRDKITSTSA